MAYLAKEQSLKQWAQLVSQTQVASLNRIQNTQFTSLMLTRLDPSYFQPLISSNQQALTLTQLFTQIIRYYSTEIGTNINHILSDNINIYSSNSIEQLWQLVLGIAIKGRNRENNINTILRMRTQTQEQLMRIISKLINKLGENVSVIESSNAQASQSVINVGGGTSNDTNIIMELSEENQQLRERVEDLASQLAVANQKNGSLRVELEARNKERKDIINIMIKEPISSKAGYSYSSGNADSIAQFIKDLISQVNLMSKQLSKKQQKQLFFQDVNKDLKLAYSAILMQLEQAKTVTTETHIDIKQVEKQIEELRAENRDYAEREKDYVGKIRDLEEQKFYLKDIIQRLEIKNNLSEKKIDKILANNKVSPMLETSKQTEQKQSEQFSKMKIEERESLIQSTQIKAKVKDDRQKTMRNEIDELKEPSQRNKLQRQVSHLQKKLNSVQEQNQSLKKINSILEKVINQFTKENEEIIKNYQSEIQPIFELFSKMIAEEQQKTKTVENEANQKQKQNQAKMQQLLQKIKEKMDAYDSRQIEYQKAVKKIQIERDQLLKALKLFEDRHQAPEKVRAPFKVAQGMNSITIQNKNQPETKPEQKSNSFPSNQPQQTVEKKAEPQEQQKVPEIKIEQIIKDKQQPKEPQPQQDTNHLAIKITPNNTNIAASIIMQQQQQQTNFRRRQYSFMGNKQSTIQIGNDGLGFKERVVNKMSSIGSYIGEEVEKDTEEVIPSLSKIESLHVQIIDITQIEEQLNKIKEHYIGLTNQSQKMCQQWIKDKKQQPEPPKQSVLPNLIKDYEALAQPVQSGSKIDNFLKKYESEGLEKGQLTAQNIKIKKQNQILKKQVLQLCKQREAVQQRLTYLHQQSSKTHSQRTKQQLSKLSTSITQIRNLLFQSQNTYIEIQEHLCQSLGEGDKLVGQLTAQIETLKQEVKQRQYAIQQLEMESGLLMGAVLEFRNGVVNSY